MTPDRLTALLATARKRGVGRTFAVYLPLELSERMQGAEMRAAAAGRPIERGYWADVARAAFTLMCEESEKAAAQQSVDADIA